jgi:hypothetical protein
LGGRATHSSASTIASPLRRSLEVVGEGIEEGGTIFATAASSSAARVTTSAARAVGDSDPRATGTGACRSLNWLDWLIPVAAVAALLIHLLAEPTERVVEQGAPAVQSLVVGGFDIGKQVTDSISSLPTTLGGITDAASAQAALPKLQEVATQIDKVDGMIGQLSAERTSLARLVNPLIPTLNQLFDQVLAIPGVAEVSKPTIDSLKTKLAALAA